MIAVRRLCKTCCLSSCARDLKCACARHTHTGRGGGNAARAHPGAPRAPPRAAGQPSLKELRRESSESGDERVGVYSSGGPCNRGGVLLNRPPSRCPSAGSIGGAHLENQDQASRCLNGAAAADAQVLQQRSSGSSTRQVQGMPAAPPSCGAPGEDEEPRWTSARHQPARVRRIECESPSLI